MARVTTAASSDLWHHYGRARAEHDREVPGGFRWGWDQVSGPGAEVLGELSGRVVGDLGAGAGRQAAHLAVRHGPARVDAVDGSGAQCGRAEGLFGHLAPRLRVVRADAVAHLRAAAGAYDVLYSLFGAVCFADPRDLLPAAFGALRPGGRLVFATLAECVDGTPARAVVEPVEVGARTAAGEAAAMRRWVLRPEVWERALTGAGFAEVGVEGVTGVRGPGTSLVTAHRPG
jgi:SAM-dependent methyltransferase